MPRISSDSSVVSSWSEVSSPSLSFQSSSVSASAQQNHHQPPATSRSTSITPSKRIIRIQPHSASSANRSHSNKKSLLFEPQDQEHDQNHHSNNSSNMSNTNITSIRTTGSRHRASHNSHHHHQSNSNSSSGQRRRSRSVSSTPSRSSHQQQEDNQFQNQHDQMLARQQFRTKTGKVHNVVRKQGLVGVGISSSSSSSSLSHQNNNNHNSNPNHNHGNGIIGSTSAHANSSSSPWIQSMDSVESGQSNLSRRSERIGPLATSTPGSTDYNNSTLRENSLHTNGNGKAGRSGSGANTPGSRHSHHHHHRHQGQHSSKSHSVKRVIQELNKAIGHERRIAAITNACAEFDHWDTEKHNSELHHGSANVLSLVLSMTDEEDEIRMICAALEMVYRASTDMVRKSFQDVGPAVVPVLLKLLERCENANFKHADVSILNITKVLLYFSRVSELRAPLARHQGMLNAMARVSTAILNPDSRVLRMRVIANMSNEEENKLLIMKHTDLLDSILRIAALDLSESAREYASAALMDIASSSNTQMQMARNDKLLATLVKLSVKDERGETREYAVTALQNLAFSKENRSHLVAYSNGVVLEALKKGLSVDPNDKTRRRAAGALTNLACDETASVMGSHEGLIDVLSRVTTDDTNYDVQKRACLALTKIASSCTSEDESFEMIMNALVHAAASPNSTGIPAVFRVQARDASRRSALARLPGILKTLAEMSTAKSYSAKDKDNATRAIMHLTNEKENRKILCNKIILNALVQASTLTGPENSETRDSAIVAIERLATEVTNRQYMARHDGLLVAIANATERESKSALNGEKTTQPRLAKQLLMSLLLAM